MSSSAVFSRPCPKNGKYDVFLSFRGKDTRRGFTSNLYYSLMDNNVYTFMDVKLVGKVIDDLFEIIAKSKMAVVVYSKEFASSDWCLRELETIMQRRKEKKMLMLPIFYDVDVHELKHLTGNTGGYLNQHIEKYGETVVQKWKDVVTTLGNVSGIPNKDRNERDLIKDLIVTIKDMLEEWVDEKKESTSNQQADEKIQALSVQTYRVEKLDLEKELSFNDQQKADESFPHTRAGEEGYRIVTCAYFQKSNENTGGLLNIKPSPLIFYVEPMKDSSSYVILKNKTDICVAFKVQTTQPLKYRACPDMGLLLPHSTCQVIVTMVAQITVLPAEMEECSDIFMVQSVMAKHHSYSTDDFSAMFTEESGNTIDKSWMRVAYVSKRDHSEPDNIAQLANKGLVHESVWVMCVDPHPTKPWLLLGLQNGSVCIWNCETRVEEKSFKVDDDNNLIRAKFIPEKHWIVVGTRNGFVSIYDYNTSEKVKEFKAHENVIACVEVHPTLPYVLTGSHDELIKLWNWENDWVCSDTFEADSYVTCLAFNPEDSSSFASMSVDGFIKLWSFSSSVTKPMTSVYTNGLNCVNYFVGDDDKLYLLSDSSYDQSVEVWDYEFKTRVQTLEGHSSNIMSILVHPKLPIIITGSLDNTICSSSYGPVNLDEFGVSSSSKLLTRFVLGCENGIIVIKIVKSCMREAYVAKRVSSEPDQIAQLANKEPVHESEAVMCVDPHPTKPLNGSVCIWNCETRVVEKSLKVVDSNILCAKFVHEKHWIVIGDINGFVHVCNYITSEKVKEFKAHEDYIFGVAVHPTWPYVFTSSEDKLIKLWNWDNEWAWAETFKGHQQVVTQIAFNPKDSCSFASASQDGTIKIWSFGSSTAKFTINAHAQGVSCVEYFVGNDDKLYLVSGSDDSSVRVWDYKSKSLIQILEGHSNFVVTTLVHPKLPFIITGSGDNTVRIWNKNTHRLESVYNCDMGQVWSIGFIEASDEIALGCEDGMVVIKIVNGGTQTN